MMSMLTRPIAGENISSSSIPQHTMMYNSITYLTIYRNSYLLKHGSNHTYLTPHTVNDSHIITYYDARAQSHQLCPVYFTAT